MSQQVQEYFENLKGKKVAFLGIGVSHKQLIHKFVACGAEVTLCDMREMDEFDEDIDGIRELGISFQLGKQQFEHLERFDMVFRTPGIYFNRPEIQQAIASGANITSEMEEFFKLCPCKIIAITGADGKTTTTTLISEILAKQGYTVHKGGNIGRALLPIVDEIDEGDIAVVELSSFQLLSMKQAGDITVVTNVQPNHLNVHKDYGEYKDAKKNLIIYQKEDSKTILNLDNEVTREEYAPAVKGQLVWFSKQTMPAVGSFWDMKSGKIYYNDGEQVHFIMTRADIRLIGDHNVENYLTAIAATWGLADTASVLAVARNFGGVEHRMEFVREVDGVEYYNDSIASSPDRTIAGLKAREEKVILIAGGKNKGLVYDKLGPVVNEKVKVLIVMGETADVIEQSVKNAANYDSAAIKILHAADMEQAVALARENAQAGDIVSLSPASTSFDKYKNFERRGQHYKQLVNCL
ncbi:MAG: UDP-N-acetylmuramoyl-L-alanine--D-glutamate ligase [Ruminococcaceae bacterium]|nr:UDP-N-acetylmuramoyl-L-alanine--D-glutamate ligase [Oscillospiraceae bacterium]